MKSMMGWEKKGTKRGGWCWKNCVLRVPSYTIRGPRRKGKKHGKGEIGGTGGKRKSNPLTLSFFFPDRRQAKSHPIYQNKTCDRGETTNVESRIMKLRLAQIGRKTTLVENKG